MDGDGTLALQGAIVAALKGDVALGGLVGDRVYDRPPQDVAFPYVSLGAEQSEPWDAIDLHGRNTTWQIDTWSRATGRVEARRIMAAVAARLHRGELSPVGQNLVLSILEFQTALDDPDGVTVHGVQRFEFITHI